ncbi:hypothetical protein VaNZ11_004658 [Volvox africanus]|uniref:Uncharacterized protein n=1 Tax=Volvox africanus TaxID=51714 RepID=A0ABQ5RXX8_9CHLO|nr:hypothetical protein VaNZ11_004658 [Volvox africanus]
MSSVYLNNASEVIEGLSIDPVVTRLEKVCALLIAILQSDRSRYLEARTWLLNSIASQSPPADVRLGCWEPLLAPVSARRSAGRTSSSRPSPCNYVPCERVPTPGIGEATSWPGRLPSDSRAVSADHGDAVAVGERHTTAMDSVPDPVELLTQLLMLVSEVWPEKVASLLLDKPRVFVDFFQGPGSSRRILMWFSHFSMDGMRAFKYGSYALAHYALAHREEVWDLLQWEGKHPQAPVAVAAKTHYFCELALLPTVRSLLRHHPQFWASEQWRECCRDGAVLELDRRHFCEVLLKDLPSSDNCEPTNSGAGAGSGAARLAALLRDFLSAPTPTGAALSHGHPHWQLLCQRLLHQLDERQLLRLVNTLAAGQRLQVPQVAMAAAIPDAGSGAGGGGGGGSICAAAAAGSVPTLVVAYECVCGQGGWQDLSDLVLCGGAEWGSVTEAVIAYVMAAARGPMQRRLAEDREELVGQLEEMEQLAVELHGLPGCEGQGGRAAEACSAEVHASLLFGGRLDIAGPGRRCAKDRLLLLSELWTLREALRMAEGAAGRAGKAVLSVSKSATTTAIAAAAAGASAAVVISDTAVQRGVDSTAGSERPASDGCVGNNGGADLDRGRHVVRLPLEVVMSGVRGITFERLQGGPADAGGGGQDATARWEMLTSGRPLYAVAKPAQPGSNAYAATDRSTAAAQGETPVAGGCSAAATGGQYELLLSEDEDEVHRRTRRRCRRTGDIPREGSRGKSHKSRKRRRASEDGRRNRHGSEHKRKRRRLHNSREWESPSRTRSRSRSQSSSSSEDRSRHETQKRRMAHKKQRRRHAKRKSRGSSSSSGYSESDNSSSDAAASSSPGERDKKELERCGSSGTDGGAVHGRNSRRRERSCNSLWESRRSSILATGGGPAVDSDELDELDPLTHFHGNRGVGCYRIGRGTTAIWRVLLLGASGAAASGANATAANVEIVGACDDVADLLAAAACKHWVMAILRRLDGNGGQLPSELPGAGSGFGSETRSKTCWV